MKSKLHPADFDHRCSVRECPSFGTPTTRSCRCHKTREEMMLRAITVLAETLSQTADKANAVLLALDLNCKITEG